MRDVLVFGGSGYSGLELLRILAGHPAARLIAASSDRWAGEPLSRHVPGWPGSDAFAPHDDVLARAEAGQLAFLATPNESSHALAPELLARGLTVIDLSGAFRLTGAADYASWYKLEHGHPALLDEAVYGLPELFLDRYPESPRLIANPGCYATAALLATAPLIRAGLLEPGAPLILDGKSGVTGAGRKLADELLFSEVAESIRPYRLTNHQHTPEIERFLGELGVGPTVSFTAHLLPVRRGLLVSAYGRVRSGVDQATIDAAYAEAYAGQRFVRVLRDRVPQPGPLVFTNLCDVRATLDARAGVVLAFGAIDNLVKGAAGQAVQNFNHLLGLDPATALAAKGMS